MDVVYYIKALLKKKWWIIIGTILAVAAAFFFTMGKSKLYVSKAQMSTGFTIKDQITLRDENVSLYEADVKFENVIQSITSPIVIGQVSYNLLLHDLSGHPFRQLSEQDLKSKEYKDFNREAAMRICRNKLDSIQILTSYNAEERKVLDYMKLCKYDFESIRESLSVKRLLRTDFIDIAYKSENPEQSAFVVNTLYREFTRYYRSLRSERTVENVGTFQELVEKKREELDQKVDALRMYKSSEGLLNIEAASGSELSLISQLEKSHLDESANNNGIRSSLETVLNQLRVIDQGKVAYTNNNDEIVNIRKQINDLNDEYVRTGSKDAELEQKIKDLRKQYMTAMAGTTAPSTGKVTKEELQQKKVQLEAELSASNRNLENLRNKIGSLKSSIGSYANKEANVGTLQQEVLLAQDEYNKLKEKLNSAIDNRTAPMDNFRQTLKGQPAVEPESSKRIIIMGAAGIAVFFISALSILLKEFFDSSLKSPSIFEKNIDINLISTINRADLHKYSILEVLQRKVTASDDIKKRQNTFRELLRKLRYEIEASGKSIFLFTSTEPNQGKTTLVQAVAYSLSLSNKRVLVIDTNFCNNDLTVQLEAKPTLEKFSIAPENFSIEKVRELVTTYSIDNIEVFGCQGGDYTPTEILPKNHLLNYLPQLKEYYDYILMEGAPLNDYTDSKELSEYAERVVAIFSSMATLKQNDKESIQFLKSLDEKLLGAVLNNISEDYLEL